MAARFMEQLSRLGAHSDARWGERRWPTQSISWIGSIVNTKEGAVGTETRKCQRDMSLRDAVASFPAGSSLAARAGLSAASFLNSLRWVAPRVFFLRP